MTSRDDPEKKTGQGKILKKNPPWSVVKHRNAAVRRMAAAVPTQLPALCTSVQTSGRTEEMRQLHANDAAIEKKGGPRKCKNNRGSLKLIAASLGSESRLFSLGFSPP